MEKNKKPLQENLRGVPTTAGGQHKAKPQENNNRAETNTQCLIEYFNQNWTVIPLKSKSKNPAIAGWREYAGSTVSQWGKWMKRFLSANVGITTGTPSKIIVVDVDPRNGGDETMRQLHLPPTYMVKTGGGGWHYYYLWPYKKDAPNGTDYLSGIDIKGDGGFVVAPPSIHDKTFREYEAITRIEDIVEAPEWLLNVSFGSKGLWKKFQDGAPDGNRTRAAASIVGRLIYEGRGKEEVWDILSEWNQKCKPPLSDRELKNIFEGIQERANTEGSYKQKDSRGSLVNKVVGYVLESNPTLFHNDKKQSFAQIDIGGHKEVHLIDSTMFSHWITKLVWEEHKKTLPRDHLKQVLSVLNSKALFEGKQVNLYNRVGKQKKSYYYDLSNESWEFIEVNKGGWHLSEGAPLVFQRYAHQGAQVMPVRRGNIHEIFQFINIDDEEHKLLLLIYLVSAFVPDIPHPIPIFFGSQGSAKSTSMRVLREFIDPSSLGLLHLPGRGEELVQQLSHHWAAYYDNISGIRRELSDVLCRAVTGGGFSKRKHYTNDDDFIYSLQCCIGLNGINIAAQKPDLLDRSILLEVTRIPLEKRKAEKDLWKEFEEAKPLILGAILTTLAKAIEIKPNIQVNKLPRMADFAEWGCAIAIALGRKQEDFLDAYQKNIETQNEQAINEHAVASLLLKFMMDKGAWKGTMQKLLKALVDFAEEIGVDVSRDKYWPKVANQLSRKINEVRTNLEQAGMMIKKTHGQEKIIELIYEPDLLKAESLSQGDDADDVDGNSNNKNCEIPF
jgi:hypothetical protein